MRGGGGGVDACVCVCDIYDIQWEDDGQFVCQGLNALGSEKAVATVTVVGEERGGGCVCVCV